MKKSKPSNISMEFMKLRLQEAMVAFLQEARAVGGAKGLTPKQVDEIVLNILDKMKRQIWDENAK
jgi:hypothetical protein